MNLDNNYFPTSGLVRKPQKWCFSSSFKQYPQLMSFFWEGVWVEYGEHMRGVKIYSFQKHSNFGPKPKKKFPCLNVHLTPFHQFSRRRSFEKRWKVFFFDFFSSSLSTNTVRKTFVTRNRRTKKADLCLKNGVSRDFRWKIQILGNLAHPPGSWYREGANCPL